MPDRSRSPIAADGGFGNPASDDEEENDDEHEDQDTPQTEKPRPSFAADTNINDKAHDDDDFGDDFGDDFDEFTEGDEADDFGDFDDGFQAPEKPEPSVQREPIAPIELPYVSIDVMLLPCHITDK